MKKIIAFAVVLLSLIACKPEEKIDLKGVIVGQWELTNVEFTKSAQVGSESVTIYLDLLADGSFKLYQQLGQGRFRYFTGTWDYAAEILSGSYTDGTPWSSSYSVTLDGDTLTLSTVSGSEVHTYTRTTIPSDIVY